MSIPRRPAWRWASRSTSSAAATTSASPSAGSPSRSRRIHFSRPTRHRPSGCSAWSSTPRGSRAWRYSGTGAISLLLAQRCRWVYGVEITQAAVDDAARNAEANGIANCTFLAGEVRFVLPSLIAKGVTAEVVVADPPRAGFHPKALHALRTLRPIRIVYVSCNPSTLARDVGELVRGGYRLEWVQPVDMFPHTPHIEAIARLELAAP